MFRSSFESFFSFETAQKGDGEENLGSMITKQIEQENIDVKEVRVLILENNQYQDHTIYRLEKGDHLFIKFC